MLEPRGIQRSAFTLIELMVVIAILGLLASVASLSLGGVMDRYRLSRAAETIEALDARARRSASLSREAFEAVIRRGDRELIIRGPAEISRGKAERYRLPKRVEVGEVRLGRKSMTGRDVVIGFNDRGRSPTYAVQLRRGKMTRWLIVLGISGQVIPVNSEEEVDALLSL